MQSLRDLTDVLENGADRILKLVDLDGQVGGIGRKLVAQGLQVETERDESLLHAVVEIPLELPPGCVGCDDNPCARRNQLRMRGGVGDRGPDQLGKACNSILGFWRKWFVRVRTGDQC